MVARCISESSIIIGMWAKGEPPDLGSGHQVGSIPTIPTKKSDIMECFYCGKEFTLNGKQGGQNRIFCYDCLPNGLERQERNNARRQLFHKKADEEKRQLGCSKCGYNKYGGVLEWHHINPTEKDYNPSNLWKDATLNSWKLYKVETEKCILLCANCHREWHIEHD